MKMSEVLGSRKKISHRKRNVTIGLLVTGILSLTIILVTIYGQYTGMFTISITNEIADKGIILSESIDFNNSKESLSIEPMKDVHDMLEGQLNMEKAEAKDGQYYDEEYHYYIAYTFYLKNTGKETINVNYMINILSEYKNVGDATLIKVVESLHVKDNEYIERKEKVFKKPDLGTQRTQRMASEVIETFQPGEIRKFTIFMWFDGDYTDSSMIGGAIKLEWVFAIATAGVET